MNNPWFEKKQFGWGWGLPLTWQGWLTLSIFIAFMASLDLITTDARLFIPLVVGAVIALCVIARVTSGKPEWRNGPYDFSKKRMLKTLALLAVVFIIFGTTQALYARKAHHSLQPYSHLG
jgi:hypothetical protein